MSFHSCKNKKCEGKLFDGLHFTCNSCDNITYLDCLYIIPPVKKLLLSLNIMRIVDDKYKTNPECINDEMQKTLDSCFGNESLFKFVCQICESNYIELYKSMSDNDKRAESQTKTNDDFQDSIDNTIIPPSINQKLNS